MSKFYYLEDMTQEDINKLALERNNLKQENQQLKKQKDDVVEYIKENEKEYGSLLDNEKIILRMLGEIDVED